ncbi:hypothetical protein [Paenibacillus sp. DYY-L-2]|uniref:hypothetical protein n=1 Tax=Paenibacillus sp. DYY-L-2 TaxID=3447013 RepID=UPI003F4F6CE4
MVMGITIVEKNQFSRNASEIAEELIQRLSSFDNSVLLYKVLALAIKNNEEMVQKFDESIFENPSEFREKYIALLEHALSQAVDSSKEDRTNMVHAHKIVKEYTTSELSKYFGVSITTIFNWIDQGRFEGIQRVGSYKHNRIPDDTVYIYSSGKRTLVRDVVAMWEQEEAERLRLSNEDDLSYFTGQIALYENKYNGEFERTLGAKENLTPEEETDAQVWKHLLGRQKRGFRDT